MRINCVRNDTYTLNYIAGRVNARARRDLPAREDSFPRLATLRNAVTPSLRCRFARVYLTVFDITARESVSLGNRAGDFARAGRGEAGRNDERIEGWGEKNIRRKMMARYVRAPGNAIL